MHHLSLDESFWRSAAEALQSGVPIDDVEPSLVDVARLLERIHESADRRPGGWLALITLDGSEGSCAAGLVLAALLSRRGRSILAVDLNFGDDAWARLLGADELDGIVDHVAYGLAPSRLVRPTSWGCLSLLPSGAVALNQPAILRSDKLRTCIEGAGRDHDLICLGLPFDEAHVWASGGTAGVDRAVLIGPRNDELAYERAIPRLVPRVEVLATLDVPPPGRWRPALGAALPALLPDLAERLPAGVLVRSGRDVPTEDVHSGAGNEAPSEGGPEVVDTTGVSRAHSPSEQPPPLVGHPPEKSPSRPSGEANDAATRALNALPLFGTGAGVPEDPELAADVAFLSGVAGMPRSRMLESDPSPPRSVAPEPRRLPHELGHTRTREEESGAASHPAAREGRWGMTLLAVTSCLLLGAGAFWYWRSNQQIPDGEFTFVETTSSPVGAVQAGRSLESREPTVEGQPASAAPALEPAGADAAAPLDDEAPPPAAGDSPPLIEEQAQGSIEDEGVVAPLEGEPGTPEGPRMGSEPPPFDPPLDEAASGPAPTSADVEGVEDGHDGQGADVEQRSDAASDGAGAIGATEFVPPTEGPALPFSLHVGSYQSEEHARRAAADLERTGPAFVVPVLLEGKGEWYRVFLGALPDGASSGAGLSRALEQGLVEEGTVRETPWALYLGTRATAEAAAEETARLRRSGVSAYALGEGPVHLYAGAFETAGDAELLNRQLRDRGFEAALVRRRAAEAE